MFQEINCLELGHKLKISRVSLQENLELEKRALCERCINQRDSYLIGDILKRVPEMKRRQSKMIDNMLEIKNDLFGFHIAIIQTIEQIFSVIKIAIDDEITENNKALNIFNKQSDKKKLNLKEIQYLGYLFTQEYYEKREHSCNKIKELKLGVYKNLQRSFLEFLKSIEKYRPLPKIAPEPPQPLTEVYRQNQATILNYKYQSIIKHDTDFEIKGFDFHDNNRLVGIRGLNKFQIFDLEESFPDISENLNETLVLKQLLFGHTGLWFIVKINKDEGGDMIQLWEYVAEVELWTKKQEFDIDLTEYIEISQKDEEILLHQHNRIQMLRKDFVLSTTRRDLLPQWKVKATLELDFFNDPIYNKGFSNFFTTISNKEQKMQIWSKLDENWDKFYKIKIQDNLEIVDLQFIKSSKFATLSANGVLQFWELYDKIHFILYSTLYLIDIDPFLWIRLDYDHQTCITGQMNKLVTWGVNWEARKANYLQLYENANIFASLDAKLFGSLSIEKRSIMIYRHLEIG